MYFNKRLLIFLISISGLIACKKDFLEVPDKTVILRQAYITDLKTLGDYLNGVYYEFATSFYGGLTSVYPEITADNVKPKGSLFLVPHYNWSQQADQDQTFSIAVAANSNGIWLSGYRIVRNCNFVIEKVEEYRSQNPAKANAYVGQSLALRAFAHFVLVNTFAQSYSFSATADHQGIPYIKASDYRQKVSRQSVAEVYDNLIKDLTEAIHLLSDADNDTRYFTRSAALALLARVYLFKNDYSNAKIYAVSVARQHPLLTSVDGYPDKIFSLLPLSQTESLFQLPPSEAGVTGAAGNYSTVFAGFYYGGPFIRFTATKDITGLLNQFPDDVRHSWVTEDGALNYVSKFPKDMVPGFTFPANGYFPTVLRSSEMFLTAAECFSRLNQTDSALYYVNAIRERANIPDLSSSVTGGALLDSIFVERRKEMCFEGLRMFDLARLKKSVERIDADNPAAKALPFGSNKSIAPLPQSDVLVDHLQQNSGY